MRGGWPMMPLGKLLQRYSPLVVLGVIQLVVILLAPSTPLRTSGGDGAGVLTPGESAGATGEPTGSPFATQSSTRPGAAGRGGAAIDPTTGLPIASGPSRVTRCPGTQPAPWGPAYMPPCLKFTGANGGTTMEGVTGKEIRYVFYEPVVPAALGAVGNQTGLAYTKDELCAGLRAFTKTLNKRWQLYGRKFVSLDGPGSHSGMAQGDECHYPYFQGDDCGSDAACWRAQADVIAAMRPRPAVVIGSTRVQGPFLEQIAKHKILTLGQGYAAAYSEPLAPYVWDYQMSLENVSSFGSEYFCKKLVGKPVRYAGPEVLRSGSDPLKPPVRKIAIVQAAGTPDYISPAGKDFVSKVTACGAKGVERFPYKVDPATLQQDMQTIAAKLKLGGFTTVYAFMDFLAPVYLSNNLEAADWHPEIVISGAIAIDNEVLAQLYNPRVWRYAFGVMLRAPLLSQDPFYYDFGKAYRDSGAKDTPAKLMSAIWTYYWLMGDTFQVAGPSPTIAAIERGLFNMPLMGGKVTHPAMKFGITGDPHFGQRDIAETWYCPTERSRVNGQPGRYMGVLDYRRFRHGQIDAEHRMFPKGPCQAA